MTWPSSLLPSAKCWTSRAEAATRMTDTTPLQGRCLCSAVTYEITAPIQIASHCHCDSCRRAHSAAFVSWATIAASAFRVTGGADRLVRYASSPGAHRSFCGTCGSQIVMHYDAEPDHAWVPIGSLVTPPDRLPDRHYSYEKRVAWFPFSDALPKRLGKTSDPAE